MMKQLDESLLITAGITVVYQLFFYAIAATLKFDKVTDLAGGSNFVIVILFTFFHYAYEQDNGPNDRQIALTVIGTIWGVRLSAFLFYRVMKFQTDRRFDGMREDPIAFLVFWVLQMLWVWTVSLPVIYVNSTSAHGGEQSLTWADYIGFSLAGFGFLLEAWSDHSKMMSKVVDGTKKWCNAGPWMYSRHPNYFGEILFWWAIFISASQSFSGNDNKADNGYFTIAGPGFITILLLSLSGLPILEKNANIKFRKDPDYLSYRQNTSPLILLPHSIYSNMPMIIKRWIFFEWTLYEQGLEDGLNEKIVEASSK